MQLIRSRDQIYVKLAHEPRHVLVGTLANLESLYDVLSDTLALIRAVSLLGDRKGEPLNYVLGACLFDSKARLELAEQCRLMIELFVQTWTLAEPGPWIEDRDCSGVASAR